MGGVGCNGNDGFCQDLLAEAAEIMWLQCTKKKRGRAETAQNLRNPSNVQEKSKPGEKPSESMVSAAWNCMIKIDQVQTRAT